MAKRFTFRFDTMLKVRKQREDERKRVVANRLRQISRQRDQISDIERQIRANTGAIRDLQAPGTIDLQQAVKCRHWISHLHKTALEGESRLRFLESKLAQERSLLAETVKHRRILDKLKQSQGERHRKEEDRREVLEADDLSTTRYVFNRKLVLASSPG